MYGAYIDETIDRGVIAMEYIEGDVLRDVWEDIADDEQEGVISQLCGHMEELRGIKAMGRRLEEQRELLIVANHLQRGDTRN